MVLECFKVNNTYITTTFYVLKYVSSFIPLVHCVQAFTHLRTDDFLSALIFIL